LIGLSDLDNESAAIEFCLVQEFDGLFSSLGTLESDEAIACGAGTTKDDLGGDAEKKLAPSRNRVCRLSKDSHVIGNGTEEILEALVGGGIGEITSEHL
jgi:hypothetical protein